MIIIKTNKVNKIFNKFPESAGKIRINSRKFSAGNFQTHNPTGISHRLPNQFSGLTGKTG